MSMLDAATEVPNFDSKDMIDNTTNIRDTVALCLQQYLEQVDGQKVTDLYDFVLTQVEPPMLEAVLDHTRGNQSKAAEVLGLNRGTLRKKLKRYNLL